VRGFDCVLAWQTMFDELERFCDPGATTFDGYATTRDRARNRWADAFSAFLHEIEDRVVRSGADIDLVGSHGTVNLDGVGPGTSARDAFFATLDLTTGILPLAAAEDFAGAWRAGMLAIIAGPGSSVSGDTVVQNFASWVDVETRYAALRLALLPIFSTPRFGIPAQLERIARAFLAATDGIQALSLSGEPLRYR
jgi:hypothetical protein